MATDIVMPQMGESIVEGTITKWLKKPGDKIQRDEPLFEISTDKVDAEIPAPASGVLQEIKVTEGTTVQVNTVVGTIASDGEVTAKPAPVEKKSDACTACGKGPGTCSVSTSAGFSSPTQSSGSGARRASSRRGRSRALVSTGAKNCPREQRRAFASGGHRAGRKNHQAGHSCVY